MSRDPTRSWLQAAVVCYRQGEYARAEALARKLRSSLGPVPPVLEILGLALVAQGRSSEAESDLRVALRAFPESRELHFALGVVASDRGAWDEALDQYRRVLDLDPDFPGAKFNHARALDECHKTLEAIESYRDILESDRENVDAAAHYAALLEECNRPEEARVWVTRVLERRPRDVLGRLVAAQLALREQRYSEALALLEELDGEPLGLRNSVVVTGRRVRVLDALHRYEEAALAADHGHARLKTLAAPAPTDDPYSPEAVEAMVRNRRLIARREAGWIPPEECPEIAFLVGFPRSGTTLLDRMLAVHSSVRVLEEENPWAPFFRILGSRLESGRCDDVLGREGREVATRVARGLQAVAPPPGGFLLDKLPLNSIYVGWLALLFPRARFVIAVRDPRDVVLSCWLQAFAPNVAMRQFWDLGTATGYYGQVMTVLRGWLDDLPPDRYRVVRYEDLVSEPARILEALCVFLGIDFRPGMIDPRSSARGVRLGTPSYDQVSRPLYGDARGRWRHYRARLDPHLGALRPWIRYWGYADSP